MLIGQEVIDPIKDKVCVCESEREVERERGLTWFGHVERRPSTVLDQHLAEGVEGGIDRLTLG